MHGYIFISKWPIISPRTRTLGGDSTGGATAGEFPYDRLRTKEVTCFHSANDSVLEQAFPLGEALPLLASLTGALTYDR
eukprot:COSAG05_NODE_25_length_31349_cov_4.978560_28_plen_79_part_00